MLIPFQERQPWKLVTQTVHTKLKATTSLGKKATQVEDPEERQPQKLATKDVQV